MKARRSRTCRRRCVSSRIRGSESTSSKARSRTPFRTARPPRSRSCDWTPTGTSRRGTSGSTSIRGSRPAASSSSTTTAVWRGAGEATDEYRASRATAVPRPNRRRGQAVRRQALRVSPAPIPALSESQRSRWPRTRRRTDGASSPARAAASVALSPRSRRGRRPSVGGRTEPGAAGVPRVRPRGGRRGDRSRRHRSGHRGRARAGDPGDPGLGRTTDRSSTARAQSPAGRCTRPSTRTWTSSTALTCGHRSSSPACCSPR